ncbi:prolipoprotein diacylglyceryl transferase [Paenibacillus gansuensis]|uniref:Prolipoprotein diacylglyceryl transferase n=1 Tax=Paenibacillus gansuensis TaxID=306542 RepID=A0ABW5P7M8_9BACL
MTFPVLLDLGFVRLHPHFVFESLAYFIGFRLYLYTRDKSSHPPLAGMWVLVGAILGGALGSKLLYWLEDPGETLSRWNDYTYVMGGKTIVGGLLGGLIGVEWTKKRVGITRSTGDDMAVPLCVGIALGRIGCFLTGLEDHTYGKATAWWTGIDFGDGILRHPTQLYEIALLMALGCVLFVLRRQSRQGRLMLPNGALFQMFMFSYLLFRFFIDFIKPVPHVYGGLNNIQLACLAGLIYYANLLRQWNRRLASTREEPSIYAD